MRLSHVLILFSLTWACKGKLSITSLNATDACSRLAIQESACATTTKDDAGTDHRLDKTPPVFTSKDVSYPAEHLTTTRLTISFSRGRDNVTPPGALKHRLVTSSSNNIRTAADARANGTERISYESSARSYAFSSLTAGQIIYFGIFVKDEAGNETYYTTSKASNTFCGGGPGTTVGNAWHICNLIDLNSMHDDLTAFYKLVSDIDASDTVSWADGAGWKPLGTDEAGDDSDNFTGGFDGNAKVIKGLTINRPTENYVGLFGCFNLGSAVVENVGLLSVSIVGKERVGAIAGEFTAGALRYAFSSGSVSGERWIGGLVGVSRVDVSYSLSTADISSSSTNTGGLIGSSTPNSSVSFSAASGDITASGTAGGLVGYIQQGTITDSHASGNVSTTGSFAAGLVGATHHSATTQVHRSTASGNVYSPAQRVGGITSWLRADSSISYSVATGHTHANYYTGGAVGHYEAGATISYSLATGYNAATSGNRGALLGLASVTPVTKSYAYDHGNGMTCSHTTTDTECNLVTTGSTKPYAFRYAPELEYVQMKYEQTSTLAMRKVSAADATAYKVWGACKTQDQTINVTASDGSNTVLDSTTCSVFSWEKTLNLSTLADGAITIQATDGTDTRTLNLTKETSYCTASARNGISYANDNESGVDGTSAGKAYTICTPQQFDNIRLNKASYFKLMNSIDLTDIARAAIGGNSDGSVAFSGELDGNGFIVRNMHQIAEGEHPGLIGQTGVGATIKSLGAENMNLVANVGVDVSHAGLLVSEALGAITDVYIQGQLVTNNGGTWRGMGPIGAGGPQISGAFANVNVTANSRRVGGLIGAATGSSVSILNSKAIGHVIGTGQTGGLIGSLISSGGTVRNSSAHGHVLGSGFHGFGGFIGNVLINSTGNTTIEDCYSSGSVVTALDHIGGFVGNVERTSSGNITISQSYASGHVITNNSIAGGYVGALPTTNALTIGDSFALGYIAPAGAASVGAFAGTQTLTGNTLSNVSWWNHAGNPAACLGTTNDATNVTCNNDGGVNYTLYSSFTDQTPLSIYTNWDFTNDWKWPTAGGVPMLKWEYEP